MFVTKVREITWNFVIVCLHCTEVILVSTEKYLSLHKVWQFAYYGFLEIFNCMSTLHPWYMHGQGQSHWTSALFRKWFPIM